jgi:hypothetical protein
VTPEHDPVDDEDEGLEQRVRDRWQREALNLASEGLGAEGGNPLFDLERTTRQR